LNRWLLTKPPVENTQLYKNRRGGRVAHGKSIERRGERSVELCQQVAGQSRYTIVSGGKRQGYWARSDPIALGLSCQAYIDPHILVALRFLEGADERLP
jgi:hypothetical protein